ncbi:hypothetical protein [Actinophytocola xanthii]|uniref:Uncharacterized protein n=1 Tax=Actinophytocola xanthii TaxID=1912961 RepID=A0A1Q8CXP5_9PSEU|nr:hypothetical protein [Actinophytocola xanthii]OLF19121.1 hypothetical protein BU204_01745 [Actinophytocola xanthii]
MKTWSRVTVAAVAAAAALFVVFAAVGQQPPDASPEEAPPPAAGWRWESYGGVDVQVPDEWGHGTTGTPPCLPSIEPDTPYVGRPGAVESIGCMGPSVPELADRSAYLWFDSSAKPGVHTHDGGWVEETRLVAGVPLTVFSDDATERTRILNSARRAATDGEAGCPTEHPVLTGPDARPTPAPGGLPEAGEVRSATLCRYALTDVLRPRTSPVLSRTVLSADEARAVVAAVTAAPQGEGPNQPESCIPEVAYGDEVLLLLVRDSARTHEVFVRYSGCDGHGMDDGTTHRRLTPDALTLLLSGSHRPTALNGIVADVLREAGR